MMLGVFLVVWWFVVGVVLSEYSAKVDGYLILWLGLLVLIGSLWALWYYMLIGFWYLIWDMGKGYDLDTVMKSGWAIVVGSVLLIVLTIVVIC